MSATFAIIVLGLDFICCILCSHMCCLSEYMLSSPLALADTLSGTCHSALVNTNLVTVELHHGSNLSGSRTTYVSNLYLRDLD